MRCVLALALLSAPALAEPPRMSLVIGADRLDAPAADILDVRREETGQGQSLYIRLAPGFDARLQALTARHVGATGDLQICAVTVLSPVIQTPIDRAVFVITDPDPARIDRLQAMLESPTCDGVTGG